MTSIIDAIFPTVSELTETVDWTYILRIAMLMAAGVCIFGGILRLICGKNSNLVRSVSACVSLLLIYLTTILLFVLAPVIRENMAQLPFVTITDEEFSLWNIAKMSLPELYGPTLKLFILAFLVNLLETVLPQGEKPLSWYGFRLLTVVASLAFYTLLVTLVEAIAPEVFGEWAIWVLLGLWVLILLTGLIKLLTAVLAAVNSVVAALYAFFFVHIFGKQFSKSILTTVLSMGLLVLLYRLGFDSFAFESFSLASYGPACVIALLSLYLFGKLL